MEGEGGGGGDGAGESAGSVDVLDLREGATESGAGGVLQVRNDVPITAVCRYWRSHSVKQMLPRDYAHTHRHTCSHACMRACDILGSCMRMHARTVLAIIQTHKHAHACRRGAWCRKSNGYVLCCSNRSQHACVCVLQLSACSAAGVTKWAPWPELNTCPRFTTRCVFSSGTGL